MTQLKDVSTTKTTFTGTEYLLLEETRNPERYPGQRILVVRLDDYAHLVPFVETADGLLLKTIIPSRKATRRYISET
jgi:hypothetical protein